MSAVRQGAPVRLGADVHAELQQVSLQLSAEVGRRLTLGQVVAAALRVASAHRDEFARAVTPESPASDGAS